MEFNSKVEYSIEDWRKYQDDEDISLAIGRVVFLSDKPNSHHHVYSIDVIKEYAPTFLGKFVVSKYDDFTQDATTHVSDQSIVGYIPTTQEIQYEKKSDGYWYASAEVVLSKIYAPEIYQLFKEENYRSVSVEQLVGFSKETENYEDGTKDKIVVGFEGIGITILGKRFNPSVKGANIQLTRMSDDIQTIEEEYVKYSQKESNVVIMQNIKEQLDRIESKLSKEEVMAENTTVEIVEEEQLSEVEAIQEETVEAEVVEMAECEKAEETVDEEMAETETETEQDEQEQEEVQESEDVKMAELENSLNEAQQLIAQYEAELNDLRQFKANVQMSEKNSIIGKTLSQVRDFVDEEVYKDFSEKGNSCKYEEIGAWRNEVLASITEKTLEKMSELSNKEEGIVEIDLPKETEVKTSIYD